MGWWWAAAGAVAVLGMVNAGESAMKLTSAAFGPHQAIPRKYTGEGEDVSPPLSWTGAPAGVRSYVLICDDPDAMRVAGRVWDHWLIWNIPAHITELPEGVARRETVDTLGGARQGMNSWPRLGYNGPMPPRGSGVHHYYFRLYALDTMLDVPPRANRAQLEAAMKGHVLATAELVGTYLRQ